MNRLKSRLTTVMRSCPTRAEEGWVASRLAIALAAVLVGVVGLGTLAVRAQDRDKGRDKGTAATPSHSTTIALTSSEEQVVVVNREANSVSIIEVKDKKGNDIGTKIAEIGVGEEPRCVAIHPNDEVAYVTNGISGTVSVIDLTARRVVATISVGTEPRGCALTPNGTLLYVANHTDGTASILSTRNPLNPTYYGAVNVGRNPTALAITNNGDDNDSDETVFVTQIFAELNPDFKDPKFDGNGENRDLGKRGVLQAFQAG